MGEGGDSLAFGSARDYVHRLHAERGYRAGADEAAAAIEAYAATLNDGDKPEYMLVKVALEAAAIIARRQAQRFG